MAVALRRRVAGDRGTRFFLTVPAPVGVLSGLLRGGLPGRDDRRRLVATGASTMIGRREILRACAAAPLVAVARHLPAIAGSDQIAFNIVRKDSVIGTHVLDFAPEGD